MTKNLKTGSPIKMKWISICSSTRSCCWLWILPHLGGSKCSKECRRMDNQKRSHLKMPSSGKILHCFPETKSYFKYPRNPSQVMLSECWSRKLLAIRWQTFLHSFTRLQPRMKRHQMKTIWLMNPTSKRMRRTKNTQVIHSQSHQRLNCSIRSLKMSWKAMSGTLIAITSN
jgi:hypothetical protein